MRLFVCTCKHIRFLIIRTMLRCPDDNVILINTNISSATNTTKTLASEVVFLSHFHNTNIEWSNHVISSGETVHHWKLWFHLVRLNEKYVAFSSTNYQTEFYYAFFSYKETICLNLICSFNCNLWWLSFYIFRICFSFVFSFRVVHDFNALIRV